MAITDFLFPEGDFLNIRSTAPNQRDYNIRATADLVRNNPLSVLGEIYAPGLTAATSIPYDVIQGIGRAVDQSDIGTGPYRGIVDDIEIPSGPSLSDIGQAIDAENPLKSAIERTVGAATPLAERISSISNPFRMSQAAAAEPNIFNTGIVSASNASPFKFKSMAEMDDKAQIDLVDQINQGPRNISAPMTLDEIMAGSVLPPNLNRFGNTIAPLGIMKQAPLDMDRFKGVSDMSIIDEVTNDEQSQEYINQVKESQEGGLAKLFKTLVGLAIPGSNFFMGNKGPLQGIKALNQRLRNTDFAKSKTLADYFDARSYGGRDARDRAAAKTMREARALQKQIDMRKSARATNQDKGRGQIISRTNSAPKSSRSSGFSSSARGKALHG